MENVPKNIPTAAFGEDEAVYSQRMQRVQEPLFRVLFILPRPDFNARPTPAIADSCSSLPTDSAFWGNKDNWFADSNAFIEENTQASTVITSPAPQPKQSIGIPTQEFSSASIASGCTLFGDEELQKLLVSIVKTEPDEGVEVIDLVQHSDSETDG